MAHSSTTSHSDGASGEEGQQEGRHRNELSQTSTAEGTPGSVTQRECHLGEMLGGEDGRAGAASGTASGWLPRLWGLPARAGYGPDSETDTGLTFTVREAAVQLLPPDVGRSGCRFSFGACVWLGGAVEGGTWTWKTMSQITACRVRPGVCEGLREG